MPLCICVVCAICGQASAGSPWNLVAPEVRARRSLAPPVSGGGFAALGLSEFLAANPIARLRGPIPRLGGPRNGSGAAKNARRRKESENSDASPIHPPARAGSRIRATRFGDGSSPWILVWGLAHGDEPSPNRYFNPPAPAGWKGRNLFDSLFCVSLSSLRPLQSPDSGARVRPCGWALREPSHREVCT